MKKSGSEPAPDCHLDGSHDASPTSSQNSWGNRAQPSQETKQMTPWAEAPCPAQHKTVLAPESQVSHSARRGPIPKIDGIPRRRSHHQRPQQSSHGVHIASQICPAPSLRLALAPWEGGGGGLSAGFRIVTAPILRFRAEGLWFRARSWRSCVGVVLAHQLLLNGSPR